MSNPQGQFPTTEEPTASSHTTRAVWLNSTFLRDPSLCPVCGGAVGNHTSLKRCSRCGLSLAGPNGLLLWEQSQKLAEALESRANVLARLRSEFPAPQPGPAPRPGTPGAGHEGRSGPGEWCNIAALSDPTKCPDCGMVMRSEDPTQGRCPSCGLFVSGPLGLELWNRSQDVAHELQIHARLVDTMRAQTPVRPVAPVTGPPTVDAPEPPASFGFTQAPAVPAMLPPEQGARTGFFSIQNVLLILGAALLGGAGIVFLVFSWGRIDLAVRAIVIGSLTAALFAGAWFARRRNLQASAESLGGLASLLLCLDAWALHATDVITGIRLSDYLAMMSVLTGIVLIGVGYALKLKSPRLIGTFLIPLGTLAWAFGQSSPLTASAILSLGALTGLLGFAPRVDVLTRRVLGSAAAVLLPGALLTSLFALAVEGPGAGALSLFLVSVVLCAHAWVATGTPKTLTGIASAILLTSAGFVAGFWIVGPILDPEVFGRVGHSIVPLIGAFLGTLAIYLLTLVSTRETGGRFGLNLSAAKAAAVTFCAAALPTTLWFLISLLATAISGIQFIRPGPGDLFTLGTLLVGALVLQQLPGLDRFMASIPPWVGALILFGLPLELPNPSARVLALLVLAIVVAAAATRVRQPGSWRAALRVLALGAAGLAILAAGGALLAGLRDNNDPTQGQALLGVSLIGFAVVLVLARSWRVLRRVGPESTTAQLPSSGVRTGLLATAVLLIGSGIALGADALVPYTRAGLYIAAFIVLTPCLILIIRSMRATEPLSSDLRAMLIGAAPLGVLTSLVIVVADRSRLADWVAVLGVGVAVLILTSFGVLTGSAQDRAPDRDLARQFAAGAIPFAVVVVLRSFAAFDLPIRGSLVIVIALSALPFLAGHTITRARQRHVVLEVTTAVLLATTLLTMTGDTPLLGIGFLIVAAGALALATLPERGVFVWIGCALTIIGAWTLSAANDVSSPEAYSAPVALLIIALGVDQLRRGRSRAVLLAGVVLLMLPTAVLASDDRIWRAAVLTVLACALTGLSAALARGRVTGLDRAGLDRTRQWPVGRDLGLVTLTMMLLGPWRVALDLGGDTSSVGVWTAVTLILAACVMFAIDVPERWRGLASPRVWGPGLLAIILTLPILALVARTPAGGAFKAVVVVSLLAVWGVVAFLGSPPGWPNARSAGDVAIRTIPALVLGLYVATVASRWTPVPGDVLLTVAGIAVAAVTIRLMLWSSTVSSWATVGFGVLATVLPASVTMLADPTGWRVSLAVLSAFAWLLLGLRQRWQAPVTLGVMILLGQVLVLAGPPALAAVSGLQGWVALALVGGVLLAAGLLYERQVARAKTAVRRFSDLR